MPVIGKPAGKPGNPKATMPPSSNARSDKSYGGPSSGSKTRIRGGYGINQSIPSGSQADPGTESPGAPKVPSGFGKPSK